MKTILGLFTEAARRDPNAGLFRQPSGIITYGDIARRVATALQIFASMQLCPRDRVVCYAEQTLPLGMFMLAGAASGVIAAPISPVFSDNYLSTLCRQLGARAIFTTRALADSVAKLGYPVICYGGDGDGDAAYLPYPTIFGPDPEMGASEAVFELGLHTPALPDPFIIQPTSGSTGAPKLVLRRHAAFSRYAHFVGNELEKAWQGQNRPPRFLAANALTHAFAGHMFATTLRFGGELVVLSGLDININLEELRTLDPDFLPMTPRVLRSLRLQQGARQEPPTARLYGPSAKVHVSAGGRGDSTTFQKLRNHGVEIIEFYGSSEASLVSLTPMGEWTEGIAGRPVADVKLSFNSGGEILVQSPGLMVEYYGDNELTELVFDEDGNYRTGDLGEIDDKGYLRILGRKRDLFNTVEGTNIYPERIEIMLESLDFVEQVFLVGDGQPYISAHIALRHPRDRVTEDSIAMIMDQMPMIELQGFLDPHEHQGLYERAGKELARINQRLELVEQIVAFSLYGSQFPAEVYTILRNGKARRNRPAFVETFASSVELMYSYQLEKDSLHLVPPRERRYRPRVEQLRK